MRKLLPLLLLLCITSSATAIEITEIMYQPTQKDTYNEWIEIYSGSPVDLSDYTLCGKPILSGYVDRDKLTQNDAGLSLKAGQYAIITDGGSGTEVYDNFDIDPDAISLSVDASSLCNTLTNSGKTITLESNNNTIDTVTYSPDLGASGDGDSLQFYENIWQACTPTPGSSNSCEDTTEPETVDNSATEDTSQEDPNPQDISNQLNGSSNNTQGSQDGDNIISEDTELETTNGESFAVEETKIIYPKDPTSQDTTKSITQGTQTTQSTKTTKTAEPTVAYSKTRGNINFAVFMLLFVSVILNIIFIFAR